MIQIRSFLFTIAFFFSFLVNLAQLHAANYNLTLLSKNASLNIGIADSSAPSIDSSGNLVVFESLASNLVNLDTNEKSDIFLINRSAQSIARVSVSSEGNQANNGSYRPRISHDGTKIIFESDANNIASPDNNSKRDIFSFDLASSTPIVVSQSGSGTNGNGDSFDAWPSADGRYVVFASDATNLVNGDTNASTDIFLRDTLSQTTIRVSVSNSSLESNGASTQPRISSDGAYIVFKSEASNLVNFDNNSATDIFIYKVADQSISILSVSSEGIRANAPSSDPSISSDGRYVVFSSLASNLVSSDSNNTSDVFLFDRQNSDIVRVSQRADGSQALGTSMLSEISSDATKICFISTASNLVNSDSNGLADAFAYTLSNGSLTRLSLSSAGVSANNITTFCSLNSNGSLFVISSLASNLVGSDNNSSSDIFLSDINCANDAVDTDGDNTPDCNDSCAFDSLKTTLGDCGCGMQDTDTDQDGTADCLDLCPNDSLKVSLGSCGCGIADTDLNLNGDADCLDPTINTIPLKPKIGINKKGDVSVTMLSLYKNSSYRIQLIRSGKVVQTKTTTSTVSKFKKLAKGSYQIRTQAILAGVTSQFSKKVSFKIK